MQCCANALASFTDQSLFGVSTIFSHHLSLPTSGSQLVRNVATPNAARLVRSRFNVIFLGTIVNGCSFAS
jgi:hypothetical protein